MNLNLTAQETKIYNYLKSKNNQKVAWEELAQFAKDPTAVKMKTIQRTVSEIKKKFKDASLSSPFEVTFFSLTDKAQEPVVSIAISPATATTPQLLVEVKRTPAGTLIPANSDKHVAQIDFAPHKDGYKKVITRNGQYQLNDPEWDVYKYFYNNPGRLITISELKDNVCFYKTPVSKLPARWFDSIMRVVQNLRRAVPGLDKRILTVKSTETSYIFN